MKLTVLVDNNTLIDKYYLGEPALSFFIEADGKKILFDVGYSDAFIKNAFKMDINLKNLDFIVFSHGHNDHTCGLISLAELYSTSTLDKKTHIITHPLTFNSKIYEEKEIGALIPKEQLIKYFNIKLSKEPLWLSEKTVFLGEIPRKNNFEGKEPIGKIHINNTFQDDYIFDDSALVYKSKQGLVIITGCSHSGICNIIEYAKEVCNENNIFDIIGGFHLLNPDKEYLINTIEYLKNENIKQLHPCHCTDLACKIELSKITNLNEVGVGLQMEYRGF